MLEVSKFLRIKGLYLVRRLKRGEKAAEKRQMFVIFFQTAEAYIFTELFPHKRATFKETFGNFFVEKYLRL